MTITVPRVVILTLAAAFSLYHLVLAAWSLDVPVDPLPVLVAMGLYATAAVLSLTVRISARMPIWLAALNVAVGATATVLVTMQLDPTRAGGNGYATWHVGAVGTLMAITSTRRRHGFAWLGIALLAVQTAVWGGPLAIVTLGVIGGAVWVAVAHVLSRAIAKAGRDAQQFALAEREAAEWQAAQDAHTNERQFRLGQTSVLAMPMLRRIVEVQGALDDEERRECALLESTIRDEIRGRQLLNDNVRREVMAARRRGSVVQLLDEGGIDELGDADRERVLDRMAEGVAAAGDADRIIVRTVPDGPTAVTVVGLKESGDGSASALGDDEDEQEITVWLQIPRSDQPVPVPSWDDEDDDFDIRDDD